jgi:hypothetical protein
VNRSASVPFAVSLVLLLAACPGADDPAEPVDPADAGAETAAVCLQGEPFVASGEIPLDAPPNGDAAEVSDIRWEEHPGCERMVIDLAAADGQAAGVVGAVRAEVLRDLGVVRVTLPGVESVEQAATDATFRGQLARAAYVMWAEQGRWIDLDVHLAGPAEAHVTTLGEPARVVIDLRPGGGAVPPAPVSDDRVVVLRPRPGEASYPLEVTGYARTFEANVVARLEHQGRAVADSFTTATAWVDAWGHYTITFADGPSGPIVLHVGEYSARDGTWEGVAVELRMR